MAENRPCRRDLMNRINTASFAVVDVKLFLDSHTCDSEGVVYFHVFE